MRIKIYEDEYHDAARFTANVKCELDMPYITFCTIDLETYGLTEKVARDRLVAIMYRIAAQFIKIVDQERGKK